MLCTLYLSKNTIICAITSLDNYQLFINTWPSVDYAASTISNDEAIASIKSTKIMYIAIADYYISFTFNYFLYDI